ncbi:hypothetical protein GQ44DRAFT_624647 [Phaeosphaeriaceae sp. PMI808]|nr:hypothetical protein GQ44DRAFT_624647 [Phaeosphaeriaceae sp. PMI808]
MPSSARRQQEHDHTSQQSAYQATSHRLSTGSTSSYATRTFSGVPSISTTVDTSKPLPPSPKHKSHPFRSLLGRPSSNQLDATHLQPRPYASTQRHSTNNLSLDTHSSSYHAYSRSMPSSPYEYHQAATPQQPVATTRPSSAAANYSDPIQYQPYTPQPQQQDDAHFSRQQRPTSMNTYFDATTPRAHTFPAETGITSPTMREGVYNRQRPHTWLSPTESFSDASQYSLFVQATTGLPEDFDSFSPNGPPQLQGSLFARRSVNDVIPLPLQNTTSASSRIGSLSTDWQNFEPPPFTSRVVSAPTYSLSRPDPSQQYEGSSHIAAVNRELELLGLDENASDDELPDYAQSQAEAHEKRRAEASARARELEARWRSTRGG